MGFIILKQKVWCSEGSVLGGQVLPSKLKELQHRLTPQRLPTRQEQNTN